MKVYTLKTCDSCRKATSWLREKGQIFQEIPIREVVPTGEELRRALADVGGDVRKLFNTSGQDYRRLKVKDLLAGCSVQEALELLGANGNLIKRPLLVAENFTLVGFSAEGWGRHFP